MVSFIFRTLIATTVPAEHGRSGPCPGTRNSYRENPRSGRIGSPRGRCHCRERGHAGNALGGVGRGRQLPPPIPHARYVHAIGATFGFCPAPAGEHPGSDRLELPRRPADGSRKRRRDRHGHGGKPHDRDEEAGAGDHHRRGFPARRTRPGEEELDRLRRTHARGERPQLGRRQRSHDVLRTRNRALPSRDAARGADRERLRRLSVALYPVDHRSDRRCRDQDGGRLRLRPDGERSHHQHHHQERWQHLRRLRRGQLPAHRLEQRQHRRQGELQR